MRQRTARRGRWPTFVILFLAGLWSVSGPVAAASAAQIALGARIDGAPIEPAKIDDYAALVGRKPAFVMWYPDFADRLVSPVDLDSVHQRGATPILTWEPWDARYGSNQTKYSLKSIAAGAHDVYLRESAIAARQYGRAVIVRFGHEMNVTAYPWGRGVNGNVPADYVGAWRRVVGIFRQERAANVQWLWSPNVDPGDRPFSDLYPGDAWVDWVGLDGYNWGTTRASGWQSLSEVFGSSYDALAALTAKRIMLSEIGSAESGGDKAAWIRQGFSEEIPARLPRVEAVVWFQKSKETDWRINSSPASLDAFRQIAASPLYSERADSAPPNLTQEPALSPSAGLVDLGPSTNAAGPGCIEPPVRMSSVGLSALLGRRIVDVVAGVGPPASLSGKRAAYCVEGGGKVELGIRRGRVELAFATVHARALTEVRSLGRGSSVRAVRKAFPRARRQLKEAWIVRGRDRTLVFVVGRRKVRGVAVVGNRVARNKLALRAALRRAG